MKLNPVILRGSLWVGISGLTVLHERLASITPEQIAAWCWVDSAKLTAAILVASLTVWRAFLDQSAGRYTPGSQTPKP